MGICRKRKGVLTGSQDSASEDNDGQVEPPIIISEYVLELSRASATIEKPTYQMVEQLQDQLS
jgi:hypothetical protein